MDLHSKAKAWASKSKLTQRVSRKRLVRGFKVHIRKCVDQGNIQAKAGDMTRAGMLWAEAGSYYAILLEVFG